MTHTTLTIGEERPAGATGADPCIMVIFGASGDLTKRLLMPAFYNLACDGLFPANCAIVGIAMDELTTEEFRGRMSEDIKKFSTRKEFDPQVWDGFVRRLYYTPGKFDDPAAFQRLAELVTRLDGEYQAQGNILFYMATPPSVFGMVSNSLDKAGFKNTTHGWRRIIVEKPFGHDLDSAIELNRVLLAHWNEDQLYRIDHYLGKETVQNLLAFRFSNGLFEPLWNRHHIDHIQFTVAETVGVEGRGGYFEGSGIVRDMVQNHMFQFFTLMAMEPPVAFEADAVRDEKLKVLKSLRAMPTNPEELGKFVVRGQYGAGSVSGNPIISYRAEKDVKPESAVETYVAMKMFIDNWRWAGVPFYLRSGKALPKRVTEIAIHFKKAPHSIFPNAASQLATEPNVLAIRIQPDEGISLKFFSKVPGPTMDVLPVPMEFRYGTSFGAEPPEAYERLILDCMLGDGTLFTRGDEVEASWAWIDRIEKSWAESKAPPFPNYAAGTWGPEAADQLLAQDGRAWRRL